MAKFVKLENGNYINVDHIITISGDYAYTMGFDNDWQAHAERVTKKDVEKILKASEKSAIYERRPILNESIDRTF